MTKDCGPTTYELILITGPTGIFSIDATNYSPHVKIVGSPSVLVDVDTYTFKLKVYDGTFNTIESANFDIVVSNPCETTSFIDKDLT